jgi:hypothetical protein
MPKRASNGKGVPNKMSYEGATEKWLEGLEKNDALLALRCAAHALHDAEIITDKEHAEMMRKLRT